MQNLAKSDRYALSRMIKRLKSTAPEDSHRAFGLLQEYDQSPTMGLHVYAEGINLVQLVPAHFRTSFQNVEAARNVLGEKRLNGDCTHGNTESRGILALRRNGIDI